MSIFTPSYLTPTSSIIDMTPNSPDNNAEHDKQSFDNYVTGVGQVITTIDLKTAQDISNDFKKYIELFSTRIDTISTVSGKDSLDIKKQMYKLMMDRANEGYFRALFRTLILTPNFEKQPYQTVIKPIFENIHRNMIKILVAKNKNGYRDYVNDKLQEIFKTPIKGTTGNPQMMLLENIENYKPNVPSSDLATYEKYQDEIDDVLGQIPTIVMTNQSMQSLQMMSNILSDHSNIGNIIMTLEKVVEWKKVYVYGGLSKLWKSGDGVDSEEFHYDGIVDPTQYEGNYDPRYELGYFQDQYIQSYYLYFIWLDNQSVYHSSNVRDIAQYGFQELDFRDTDTYKYNQAANLELMYVLVGIVYFGKVPYLVKEGLNTMQNGPKTEKEIFDFIEVYKDTFDQLLRNFLNVTKFPTRENFHETSYLKGPGFVNVYDDSLAINAGRELTLLSKYKDEYDVIKKEIIEILKGAQNIQLCGNVVSGNMKNGGEGNINISQAVDCQMNITTVSSGGVENIPEDIKPAVPAPITDDSGKNLPVPNVKAGSGLSANSKKDNRNPSVPSTVDPNPEPVLSDESTIVTNDSTAAQGYYVAPSSSPLETVHAVIGGVIIILLIFIFIFVMIFGKKKRIKKGFKKIKKINKKVNFLSKVGRVGYKMVK
jgi:hypothetical protein